MTKLLEALLNNDLILVATAKARFHKELMYLPDSEWKRRLIELNERGDRNEA